jgi:hypothetical protein
MTMPYIDYRHVRSDRSQSYISVAQAYNIAYNGALNGSGHNWLRSLTTARPEHDFYGHDMAAELANTIDALSALALTEYDAVAALGVFAHKLTVWTCAHCGQEYELDDATSIPVQDANGQTVAICDDCRDDAYCECERCGTVVETCTTRSVGEQEWCDSCADEYSRTCDNCGSVHSTEYHEWHQSPSGDSVCDDCPHDWSTCARCCNSFDDDALIFDEDSENDYCENCYSRLGRDSCADHPPRANVLGRRFRELRSQTCFGVELEVSRCPDAEKLYRRGTEFGMTSFGAKPDGTQGVAKEFYSPILRGDRGLKAIKHLCGFATANSWKVNRACGFHLHIDMRSFDETQRVKILSGYAATRNFWGALVPDSRRENRYCALSEALHNPASYLGMDWNYCLNRNRQRYGWMNVHCAYSAHKTIEVRLHTGTLNAAKVCNWVRAHLLFTDWCAGFSGCQRQLMERFYDFENNRSRSLDDQFAELQQVAWCADRDLVEFYRDRAALFGATLNGQRNRHVELPASRFETCDA